MTLSPTGTAFVVGSGPTGLVSAIALRTHGFDVRIIDKASEPSSHSKALVVWARTLEQLDGHLDVDRRYSRRRHSLVVEQAGSGSGAIVIDHIDDGYRCGGVLQLFGYRDPVYFHAVALTARHYRARTSRP